MQARELRYFVAVADELHFGRAAQRLDVALPVLSRVVRRTETELGVELFVRDSQPIRLTAAGQTLLAPARDALAVLDEAIAGALEAAGHDLLGRLAVGVSPLLRHRLVPSIFTRFCALYPSVRVSRREQFGGLLIEQLRERRMDCALALCPPRHHDLVYEPVRDAELRVLLSAAHPLAANEQAKLADLSHDRFQLPTDAASGAWNEQIAQACAHAGFQVERLPTPVDHDLALSCIQANEGVTLVPRFYVQTMPPGLRLLALDPPLRVPVEMVRRRERPSPALVRFGEVVREISRLDYEELSGDRLARSLKPPPAS